MNAHQKHITDSCNSDLQQSPKYASVTTGSRMLLRPGLATARLQSGVLKRRAGALRAYWPCAGRTRVYKHRDCSAAGFARLAAWVIHVSSHCSLVLVVVLGLFDI